MSLLSELTAAYLYAAWSDALSEAGQDDSPPAEVVTQCEWTDSARMMAKEDCARFMAHCAGPLFAALACDGYTTEQAGIDLWLTRNGHGAGFWDRDELGDDLGAELTNYANGIGPRYTEVIEMQSRRSNRYVLGLL
jgi:hypothetical protein